MQDIPLTETNFRVLYHHALKHINSNSDEILNKLWDIIKDNHDNTITTDEALPAVIKMPKKKKM